MRRRLKSHSGRWKAISNECVRFKEQLVELLNDWGSYLALNLYVEAITFFWGGPDEVIKDVNVLRDDQKVGLQKTHLLQHGIAFKLTAAADNLKHIEEHLRRFLQNTDLKALQWVNMHHQDIKFVTLIR